jgi:hypothetical protein
MFDPMRHARTLFVPGPAGPIETSLSEGDPARASIVLCHPHPQYGGSMHDAVLDTIERAAQRSSMATVKFNFRGVGASEGDYDHGIGEVDDLLAVLDWLRVERPSAKLWLGGYSFGSNIVWRALDSATDTALVLLVAPPIGAMDYAAHTGLHAAVEVIYGDHDAFIDAAELERWATTAASRVRTTTVAGADHFFGGMHAALAEAVEQVLARCGQNSATPDT